MLAPLVVLDVAQGPGIDASAATDGHSPAFTLASAVSVGDDAYFFTAAGGSWRVAGSTCP